jgi:hypothetical protein
VYDFVLVETPDGPAIVGHPGWGEERVAPSPGELDELRRRGWLHVIESDAERITFGLTPLGRRAARAYARRLATAGQSAVSLDWPAVTPVLDCVYEMYTEDGAPEYGVPSEEVLREVDGHEAGRAALRELVRAGYLEETSTPDRLAELPRTVRPTPLTLQLLAGWPVSSAEAVLDQLVAALDQAIESTSDPEQRSRLVKVRDGLLGAARDVALAYFEKKVGM